MTDSGVFDDEDALEQLLLDSAAAEAAPRLRRSETKERLAGPNQESIWFEHQIDVTACAYNQWAVYRIRGPIDYHAMSAAFAALVTRHEALRTSFSSVDGRLWQRVTGAVEPILVVERLANAEAVEERVQREIRRPFDLAQAPLFRATLLRAAEDAHVLVFSSHHIVVDGTSLEILASDLGALYGALLTGQTPTLPELEVQHGDFCDWYRATLSDISDDQKAFWRDALEEVEGDIDFGVARPHVPSRHGDVFRSWLPRAVAEAVAKRARTAGVTPFVILLAAYAALLARETGRRSLVIATPVTLRSMPILDPVVGMFVNTLPLRIDLSGDPTFTTLVERVRKCSSDALERRELPFDRIIGAAPRASSPVQMMFSLLNQGRRPLRLARARAERQSVHNGSAKLDLVLWLEQHGDDELEMGWEYARDVVSPRLVEGMAQRYQRLLTHAVEQPETRLSQLPLVSEPEKARLLRAARGADVDRCDALSVAQSFSRQAERSPSATALVTASGRMSYGELHRRVAVLASRLHRSGVRRGATVALLFEPSPERIIAVLATLHVGAAFLPLESDLPPARLRAMVGEARPSCVLAEPRLVEAAHDLGVAVLAVSAGGESTAPDEPMLPPAPVTASDAAYVIYTSGSTGSPKGAICNHGGLINRLAWMQERFQLEPESRVLHKTPYGFDVSVWELLWPFMVGATLVLAEPGGHRDPAYLRRRIAEAGVRVVHFVPSMLEMFLEQPGLEALTSLRHVIASGEALSRELVDRFHRRLGAELHNLYGPTEAHIDVSAWHCRRAESGPVPIGLPISNTSLYVLDAWLGLMPPAAPGQLYIGGQAVGAGYVAQPALTAARFLPDPFGLPGGRMYETGDGARLRDDGVIEYIGRLDHQVKLRGVRIELGEIEETLRRHPSVRSAAVVLLPDVRGEPQLVGYVVPAEGRDCDHGELRAWLEQHLPHAMIPSALVTSRELPRTPSGKLDRRALEAPTAPSSKRGESPKTPLEERIAAIWRDVLAVAEVSTSDVFFDLGGHSLLLMRVASRLHDTFGVEVPLRALFDAPTIPDVAQALTIELARELARDAPERLASLLAEVATVSSPDLDGRLAACWAEANDARSS
jgi:amino acid adenylation domain-containing protein